MLDDLKRQVHHANLEIVRLGLVLLTWGNASAIDRDKGLVVIKPSGVDYATMTPDDMVVVDLDGNPVDSKLRPSSDTPAHVELYRAFPTVGAIVHTHSHYATCWAQACRGIPCFGTTHADHFHGEIPVTDDLTRADIAIDYERNTGRSIARKFEGRDPLACPAVLVANHAPFAWGENLTKAVENAYVLEEVARMALHTLQVEPMLPKLNQALLDKHFLRKHGPGAYYGQRNSATE